MTVLHCFVARPISVTSEQAERYHDGELHWQHVHEHLIVPALEQAGYEVVDPSTTGANNIHAEIIEHLRDDDLVLADFSTLNPNVLYEAGIRTAVNKPLVPIAEVGTKLPFDTTTINTLFYDPGLSPWDLKTKVPELAQHIRNTKSDENALWRHFGVELSAAKLDTTADPGTASIQLLEDKVDQVTDVLAVINARLGMPSRTLPTTERSKSWRLDDLDHAAPPVVISRELEPYMSLAEITQRLVIAQQENDALRADNAPPDRIAKSDQLRQKMQTLQIEILDTIHRNRGRQ